MQPSPENNEQKLERFVHQTLRDLPARGAPGTLEHRVLAEIERRAFLPWWHKSYAHWPLVARAAFFVLSAAVAACLVAALFAVTRSPAAEQATQTVNDLTARWAWLEFARTLADSAGTIWRAIPPLWLYGTFAVVAACYAALFGAVVTAHRAFSGQR